MKGKIMPMKNYLSRLYYYKPEKFGCNRFKSFYSFWYSYCNDLNLFVLFTVIGILQLVFCRTLILFKKIVSYCYCCCRKRFFIFSDQFHRLIIPLKGRIWRQKPPSHPRHFQYHHIYGWKLK